MPDYDPKDIPTLDDIIEKGISDDSDVKVKDGIAASAEAETEPQPFDINAFLTGARSTPEAGIDEETGPRSGDLNDLLHSEDITVKSPPDEVTGEPDIFLDDDSEEVVIEDTVFTTAEYYADDDYIVDEQPDEQAEPIMVEPIEVGEIVKDIVKQMMPDLEQQLVFLLQKAIEEKLPEELVRRTDADKNTNDDD